MARKSGIHKRSIWRYLYGHIAAAGMMAICILIGTMVLWNACNARPVSREEALPVEATFRQAVEQWQWKRFTRHRRGYKQENLTLQFYDHEDMVLRYNWDEVEVAEELPYTDKRYRPVLLSDLKDGTVCTILADPRQPSNLLHLETQDGQIIVSFEESMEALLRSRNGKSIMGGVFLGFGILGSLWLIWQYWLIMRVVRRKR